MAEEECDMAWEELLKTQERREESAAAAARTEVRAQESLIRQAAAMIGQTGEADPAPPAESGEAGESVCCRDGYVRRSPVQPYGTAADYFARRIRKAVLIVVGIFLAALLVVALLRAGLLRF